ncbi:cytochrome c biogenesis heme-transporting ATPase CcmA [Glaciecola sp. SC05]|uniref:cytochrome c biogenesis heme-transporting ATPase CcmA n=1 Tax=Glaciecola sp. SC05 TaxID=1987355 RepID=UPI00352980CC
MVIFRRLIYVSKLLTVLSARDLSCEKQDRILFENVDLQIEAGELVLLRGENGAGKTSLLRILVGLSQAQAGSVSICGEDVNHDINLASQHIIYFGHKLGVSGLLSPIENLTFWCKQHGLAISHDNIVDTLETLGLEGLESLPVKYLSQGQQRRVSLARLWLKNDAKLWVLDEPMTALDVQMVAQVEQKITAFLRAGGSVLMTSHQAVKIEHEQREFTLEYRW